MSRPILYYITDRAAFPGTESERRLRLLLKIAEATRAGIDYIQLREKDLSTRQLELLARDAIRVVCENSRTASPTRLLINSRTDVALAVGAVGVHLRSNDLSVTDIRALLDQQPDKPGAPFTVSVSCHNLEDIRRAAQSAADFAVFAPVFEKEGAPSSQIAGLEALRRASQASIPVLALGGVTLTNARACLDAGAAGLAGIRLFQESDIASLVRQLRAI